MKGRDFDSYREVIQVGLQNDMPEAAKLVLLGMMWNDSGIGGSLSHDEYEQLETMLDLGDRVNISEALEYALVGSPDVEPSASGEYAKVAS